MGFTLKPIKRWAGFNVFHSPCQASKNLIPPQVMGGNIGILSRRFKQKNIKNSESCFQIKFRKFSCHQYDLKKSKKVIKKISVWESRFFFLLNPKSIVASPHGLRM
ncbi:MAG: hypothetical protein COX62_09010 [Deltaproteobacteria bacterium CG_4_10_14_0_2_um_filter_43_8]|nr:MAG: hypothetical protein COV43_04925 [Deltaproteobacteria bacterium CG11_big_fil_rev_8_21_14_0_20_42_23]PJA18217.1 MAG: hypothetical protein COX62_09010 [Deltaproteobacteria bacterium CG_4_10_14_0_2_um_filter_43_8]PJC65118.1 MAG: hypothetical protein CO021_01315 [Deltaproteobacteria bacterium CG_4_9_14_0_2_um_filter_42_21]